MLRKLRKLSKLLPVPLYRRGLLHGAAASVDHAPLLRTLKLRTIVDAGANRGQFSLLVRHLFPDAQIYAFEPLQAPALVYRRLFRDDQQCKFDRVALGRSDGSVDMHVAKADHSSSLFPIGKLQVQWAPHTEEVRCEMVKLARLDQVLPRVEQDAMLKIDVQGYELHVLEGAGSLLPRFRYVYTEASFEQLYDGQPLAHEVIDFLSAHGFNLKYVNNLAVHRGMPLQADILFERH